MARLFTTGAETGDVTEWTLATNDFTSVATQQKTGLRSFQAAGTAALSANGRKTISGAYAVTYFLRAWYRHDGTITTARWIMGYMNSSDSVMVGIYHNTNGTLQVRTNQGPTLLGSATAVLTADQWYLLELKYMVPASGSGATADDTVEFRLDTVQIYAAVNAATSGNTPNKVFVGYEFNPGAIKTSFWDEIAVNDDTGTSEITWPVWGWGSSIYPSRLRRNTNLRR